MGRASKTLDAELWGEYNKGMTAPCENEISFGFCHCGCGQKTRLAHQSHTKMGWIKGQPIRFIVGHTFKGRRDLSVSPPFYLDGELTVRVPVTRGKFALVDVFNAHLVEGIYWQYTGGYAKNDVLGKMHRLILKCESGLDPEHKNGNGLDNRLSNLRPATSGQNNCNSPARCTNKSGVKGVYFEKFTGRWRAEITVNYKPIKLGRFARLEDARKAREDAEDTYQGDFSYRRSRPSTPAAL